ncbi:GNAT family N-acetyltransferase [Kitasatospora sp. NPDC004240]
MLSATGLAGLDWLAVRGPVAEVAALIRTLRPAPAPGCLLVGEPALVGRLAARMGLAEPEPLVLMVTDGPPPPGRAGGEDAAHWLPAGRLAEVDALLDVAFPTSLARPGGAGVRRWAGIRAGGDGPLIAVSAEAWSRPDLGFVGGVAVHPGHRGHGHAAEVCGFVLRELLAEHGRAALFVDGRNGPAVALYRSLGMWGHPLAMVSVRP